ncbi:MAG: hypothetical protein LBS23_03020 [Holosporaceae bacterium]|jgi:hypothetical protein|nr:hypothetical protein [Holosporaceae bacterium]
MIDEERTLWRSVIVQALKDAKNTKLSKKERREVLEWFSEENVYFEYVCFLANVDANAVMERFLRMVKK